MIVVSNVWAQVEGAGERAAIGSLLRYRPKGYRFSEAYRAGHWNGWSTVLDRYGRFPSGLLPYILTKLTTAPEINDTRVRPAPHPEIAAASLSAQLMPHQEEAVASAYAAGQGIVDHPVGSGKSFVLVELVRRCAVPALVLVHTKELLYQNLAAFRESMPLEHIGLIGDGSWLPKIITVATYQSLHGSLMYYDRAATPKQAKEFLESRLAVLVDECQHIQAATYEHVMKHAVNAFYRFGLSATPDKSGDPETMFKVQGWTGPVVSKYTSTEGIEFGRLVPADVFVIDYGDPKTERGWKQPRKKDPTTGKKGPATPPGDYEIGVASNRDRNDVIAQVVAVAPKPVLVLMERIEHGERLAELIERAYYKEPMFIYGGDGSRHRNEALEAFRNNHVDVLVSSVILDEGVNLPNIRTLVLAGGGKAKHRLIQRMGRGMRSSTEKSRLLAFDFLDRGKYTGAHARARERVYRGEPAYTVYSVTKEDVLTALQNGLVKGAMT